MSAHRQRVSIVVPFYNEEAGIGVFYDTLRPVMDALMDVDFEVVCVDDGSTDQTLQALVLLTQRDARFRVVELSRNFGKEAALTAGLDMARGDAVIPIDADLQDPPELIEPMVRAWQAGHDVVLARAARTAARILF
jgi:polyisoprenyl-phosphate glycosyltransferase